MDLRISGIGLQAAGDPLCAAPHHSLRSQPPERLQSEKRRAALHVPTRPGGLQAGNPEVLDTGPLDPSSGQSGDVRSALARYVSETRPMTSGCQLRPR